MLPRFIVIPDNTSICNISLSTKWLSATTKKIEISPGVTHTDCRLLIYESITYNILHIFFFLFFQWIWRFTFFDNSEIFARREPDFFLQITFRSHRLSYLKNSWDRNRRSWSFVNVKYCYLNSERTIFWIIIKRELIRWSTSIPFVFVNQWRSKIYSSLN